MSTNATDYTVKDISLAGFGRKEIQIAEIEMPADPWAADFVDETRRFQWAEEELIPDVLDRDLHLRLLRKRNGGANRFR